MSLVHKGGQSMAELNGESIRKGVMYMVEILFSVASIAVTIVSIYVTIKHNKRK